MKLGRRKRPALTIRARQCDREGIRMDMGKPVMARLPKLAHSRAEGNRESLSARPASLSISDRLFSSSKDTFSSKESDFLDIAWPFIVQQSQNEESEKSNKKKNRSELFVPCDSVYQIRSGRSISVLLRYFEQARIRKIKEGSVEIERTCLKEEEK